MELFKLLGRVAIEGTDEAKKDINQLTQDASASGQKLASGFGKVMATVAKVGVVAVSTAAAGITALTKSAISNYAEYEQLVGGVETLFKDSSNKVMRYAMNAYKTAGLSANQYMETVTSFSASLLQGLGGDTEKAAQIADQAIVDMADNANKMGTSIELIQNAYQGFAKQNYTMLDNLKLGYGGTASEMARLINDSGVLGDTIEVTANTVNSVSFDKIIEAIHVVQTRMGITGTTAKEAATTIQGSISQMKASWKNLVTGMADSKQDFNQLMNDFVDSFVNAADNIVPRILETLPRVIQGLSKLVRSMVPYVGPILQELLPAILDGATMLLEEVVDNLPGIFEALFGPIGKEFGQVISDALRTIVPAITGFAQDVLPILANAIKFISENFDTLIKVIGFAVAAFETMSIVNTVTTAIQGASTAFGAFSAVLKANPIGMVVTAVGGLALALSTLTSHLQKNNVVINENIIAARDEAAQAQETLANYNSMKEAISAKVEADISQIDYTQKLWNELQTLCDAQGNVSESDRARAKFIVGELNSALGTEIEMVGNQVQGYEELDASVKNLIETKKANILLQANEEAYATAIQNYDKLMGESAEQLAKIKQLEAEREQAIIEQTRIVQEKAAQGYCINNNDMVEAAQNKVTAIELELAAERDAYDSNLETFKGYCNDIEKYESASAAMSEGNAQKVIDTYSNKNKAFDSSKNEHGEITDEIIKQFKEQEVAAENNYKFIKENYEKGFSEFSETMLKESSQAALDAKEQFKNVGQNITDGIAEGASQHGSVLNGTLADLVNSALRAAQSAAKIHSPSRLFRDQVGKFIPEGIGVGIEQNQEKAINPVKDTIKKMADVNTEVFEQPNIVSNTTEGIETISNESNIEKMINIQEKLIELLPEMIAQAIDNLSIDVNEREFGRLVRQVN